ncbi:MAG: transcription-repair coupling factor [Paenibacillaceae bacterium]
MNSLLRLFSEDVDFTSIVSGIRQGMKEQLISGLAGSSKQILMAAVHTELQRPMMIVTHNMFAAQRIVEDLNDCLPVGEKALLYPANELMVTESAFSSPDILAQRIEVLTRLAEGHRGIIVAPYAGIRKLIPPKQIFASGRLLLRAGHTIPMESVMLRLSELGYERVERVEQKGEMSIRGGIVDVYPLTSDYAYRMEWFDDEIDSIRTFSVEDQRSVDKLDQVSLPPCREIIADKQRFSHAAQHVSERLEEQLSRMTDRQAKLRLKETVGQEVELLREHQYFQDIFKYISFLYPERQTLFDYMPQDSLLFIDEPLRLIETSKQLERDEAEMVTDLLQAGRILPSCVLSKGYDSLFHPKPFQAVFLSLFLRQIPQTQPQNILNFVCRSMQNFHGQMNVLKAEMERWEKTGSRVILLANGIDRMEHIKRVLFDYHIPLPEIVDGNLQAGFELPSVRLVVITEGEIFTQKQRKVRRVDKKIENAERLKSYTELKPGDYVVHVNHGIGKYTGIGTLVVGGLHKDYIHIQYASGDRLSVPIEQIEMVQKYVSSEDRDPKINKLGGADWQRAKTKAQSSVKDIADELIKLYADRQEAPGYAFSHDSPYQSEFEAMFPYEETPDQLRAIAEIKTNMEKKQPMDRLLCGDVGYGKTEVAIRAAFKAAIEGKQVAILVPTTILAQQHYETFRERFSGFPMALQVLSRFRSKKEQTDTIKGLKSGAVDIVIGTHRLLSSDIKFKDLGLLIVDEEQRFGVSHKEKLKRLKANVDVLTLTATPIPRTLHMSLLGVRDLSVIETPPENRFPVQTYVVEYSGSLVREAIERELARNGQVYFLFNRVMGIHQMAEQISALVPEARVAVAHGQMSEQELEKTILDFLDGEFDVLVSTTIIETGVDIPNVNTLIVYDSDKMGLSQLYQLRGRVGRSNRIAYAYLTYQRDKVLSEVSEKRLQAIKEFTELGSGFKIAMRDLAIRGAGNLLGAEQHGFIASVGFDLYSQMLAEEIRHRKAALQGEDMPVPAEWNVQIDINIDAYLPSTYIYDSMQKIEVYKKAAAISSLQEAVDLYEELEDRFGDPPVEVTRLLLVAKLKVYGTAYGIESIQQQGEDMVIKIADSRLGTIHGQKLMTLSSRLGGRIKLADGPRIHITLKGKGMSSDQLLELLETFMIDFEEVIKPKGELHNVAK